MSLNDDMDAEARRCTKEMMLQDLLQAKDFRPHESIISAGLASSITKNCAIEMPGLLLTDMNEAMVDRHDCARIVMPLSEV